jgi:hypothetical protein
MMSDTGGGHRASAQALAAALQQLRPDAEPEVVDAIAEVSPFWRAVVGLYGPMVRAVPGLWGLLFHAFGGRGAWLWDLTGRPAPFIRPLVHLYLQFITRIVILNTGQYLIILQAIH